MKRHWSLSYTTQNTPTHIFNPAFFRYISILIEHLSPSLSTVSFPSVFRTQPYLLNSNKIHLLGNIYRNDRLRFLRSVSTLTEPSLGKKFKVHKCVCFSLTSVTHTRKSLLVQDTSIVVQDTDWPVRQWSFYIVNTLWWKCIPIQAFHVKSLAMYRLNDRPITAETCRRKDDLTQKGILANKYVLMNINSEVKYTDYINIKTMYAFLSCLLYVPPLLFLKYWK